ncbi:unnamed protein product, partial [Discosporangium mesarthrocarpum]
MWAQVSTTSHKGTLGLLPAGKKTRQKLVIGDDSGTIQCFEMRKGEVTSVFRFTDLKGTGMITAVSMGGYSNDNKDRIFATQARELE